MVVMKMNDADNNGDNDVTDAGHGDNNDNHYNTDHNGNHYNHNHSCNIDGYDNNGNTDNGGNDETN